jgi:hypothetical protein
MNRTPVKMVARVLFPSGQANQEFEGTEEEVCFQALMAHINKQGIATAPDTERQIQQYIHEVLSANERSEFVSYSPLCINAPGQQIKISVRGSTDEEDMYYITIAAQLFFDGRPDPSRRIMLHLNRVPKEEPPPVWLVNQHAISNEMELVERLF